MKVSIVCVALFLSALLASSRAQGDAPEVGAPEVGAPEAEAPEAAVAPQSASAPQAGPAGEETLALFIRNLKEKTFANNVALFDPNFLYYPYGLQPFFQVVFNSSTPINVVNAQGYIGALLGLNQLAGTTLSISDDLYEISGDVAYVSVKLDFTVQESGVPVSTRSTMLIHFNTTGFIHSISEFVSATLVNSVLCRGFPATSRASVAGEPDLFNAYAATITAALSTVSVPAEIAGAVLAGINSVTEDTTWEIAQQGFFASNFRLSLPRAFSQEVAPELTGAEAFGAIKPLILAPKQNLGVRFLKPIGQDLYALMTFTMASAVPANTYNTSYALWIKVSQNKLVSIEVAADPIQYTIQIGNVQTPSTFACPTAAPAAEAPAVSPVAESPRTSTNAPSDASKQVSVAVAAMIVMLSVVAALVF